MSGPVIAANAPGGAVAATAVPRENLLIRSADDLRWFRSSDIAERGFCAKCGSSLFWRPVSGTRVSIMAGAIDLPTDLRVSDHIFTGDKSDYYEICDGVSRHMKGRPR
jgi:hypothetical protein